MSPKRTKKSNTQVRYDWEPIEKDYRAGTYSNRQLSEIYGPSEAAIRKHMKKHGVEKDLSKRVDEKVRTESVRSLVRNCDAKTESEIVEEAAATKIDVVRDHRRDINRLRKLEEQILTELEDNPQRAYITAHKGQIVSKNFDIAVTDKAQALNALANVQHKRIQLERQAFSIRNEDNVDHEPTSEIVYTIVDPKKRDEGGQ